MYGFEGKPYFLPKFDGDCFFLMKFCKQCAKWFVFFDQKEQQFLSMPFKLVGIIIRSVLHLAKMDQGLSSFDMKEVEVVLIYDPYVDSLGWFSFMSTLEESPVANSDSIKVWVMATSLFDG
jgi:hypothetical protein